MKSAVIIDLALGGALLLSLLVGMKRGLYRTLVGCAVLVLAVVGANWLTGVCTAGVTDVVRPAVQQRIEARVDAAIEAQAEETLPEAETESRLSAADRLLASLGWSGNLAETVRTRVHEKLLSAGATIAGAVVDSYLETVVAFVLRLVFFLALLAVLWLLSRLLQPLFSLPVLRSANALGGGLLGLAGGALALFLLCWAAQRAGLLRVPADTLKETHLLRWFVGAAGGGV